MSNPESDPKLSEKSDPDPDTDPKKIIPDPQHCWIQEGTNYTQKKKVKKFQVLKCLRAGV